MQFLGTGSALVACGVGGVAVQGWARAASPTGNLFPMGWEGFFELCLDIKNTSIRVVFAARLKALCTFSGTRL